MEASPSSGFWPVTHPAWMTHTRGRKDNPRKYRNRGNGASSLREMALRSCIWNIDNYGEDTLSSVPLYYGTMIYDRLMTGNTLSIRSWLLFKARYQENIRDHYRLTVRGDSSESPKEIPSIAKQLSSLSFETLTFICIRNLPIDMDALWQLMHITSLRVLMLQDSGALRHEVFDLSETVAKPDAGEITDYIVRKWSDAVHDRRHFPNLRVLELQSAGITTGALKSVALFPSLVFCNLIFPSAQFLLDGLGDSPWVPCTHASTQNNSQNFNPSTILARLDIDMHRKMALLYQAALDYVDTSNLATSPKGDLPILSLDYTDPSDQNSSHRNRSMWYLRTSDGCKTLQESLDSTQGRRRRRENDDQFQQGKRKIRASRKKGVDSLLGEFF
ncbi:hypothetical protein GQ43DRAFT_461020 [Delitschia confertaspora ATCC 74209]|uniref:Uncharacterized protein n=1 Tax=Delitschia confertaspora ATCC 74209 TaxID=1513339 RepID=A0A9P4MVH3_9PLEO|nr:hypothetical protein GQ43DRAFT_461020 [Delitschia confertaspora ATCC 74209]